MHRTFAVKSTVKDKQGPLRVVLVGLGPIGKNVADECARRGTDRIVVVGAIDRDPKLVGRTLEEIWGPGRPDGAVRVVAGPADLAEAGDVALLTTTSRLDTLEPQLEPLFARGLNVVSSSEELFYPPLTGGERAERIDALAKRHKVSVTGAGINPGFLMDLLPTVLAVASGPPFTVRCERYVDLAKRRLPLQTKAGMGMTADEFRQLADAFKIGHVGLVESIAYLAGHLGIAINTIEESLDPVESESEFTWGDRTYAKGRLIGFVHQARAWGEGQDSASAPLQFYLRMSYHQEDPRDRVILSGLPPIDMTIRPCVLGDPATAAVLVHLASQIPKAAPGLRLAHEVGPVPQGPHYQVERA
jgi:hypothetical protein